MTTRKLTDQQFKDLKELYVDRIVDNMSMKDLIIYATEDMQKWVDSLTYNLSLIHI